MITKAGIEYAHLLSNLGAQTFIHAHKASAPEHEIDTYVKEKYSVSALSRELSDPVNIYHIIKYENEIAGFSKMIFNRNHPGIALKNIAKMDQIYLLDSFHGLKLGARLLQYNIEFSKSNSQNGMWLVVWVNNDKAIRFYEKFGFEVIIETEFSLTDRHTNPSYIMLLDYEKKIVNETRFDKDQWPNSFD